MKTSFESQRALLDQEIVEIRELLLNEKELVFELEDKVLFAEKIKHAAEAELRVSKEESSCKANRREDEMGKYLTIQNYCS